MTGALAQSRKCYMKIQWYVCIGRRMGLPRLLTMIYFNWKYWCPKNKIQMSALVVSKESLIFVLIQHGLCEIKLTMRILMVRVLKGFILKLFLTLLQKHFPQHHKYRKFYYKNNVKVNRSCMFNMKSVIQNYNLNLHPCCSTLVELM